MELDDARRLLQIAPEASEPERRAAFERQRQQLDERIASAATPRLAETFRLAQARLVEAYEAVELAQAATESPALRAVTDQALPPVATPVAPPSAPAPAAPSPAPAPRRLAGVVLALAALVCAGGGYAWHEQARHVRLDHLRDRLQSLDGRLAEIAREVPEPQPNADGRVDAVREQWRQQRATLRAAALDAARKRLDAHPAHAAAESARTALAQEREEATGAALDAAEQALPGAAELERGFLADYAQPLLAWCFDHAQEGDGPIRWARDEEPRAVSDVVAALRGRLAGLDHAAPPPPGSGEDVAHLAALAGADDPDAKRWKAKLDEIARLRAILVTGMPTVSARTGAQRDLLGGALTRLQALLGPDEAQTHAWGASLPDATLAEQRLRATLSRLAASDAAPTAEDLAALSALEQVAGENDRDAQTLRAAMPDRLYDVAMRESQPMRQGNALAEAASIGSWKALARMVSTQDWPHFSRLDPSRFDPAHAPRLDGDVTASQLAGEALANWAVRHPELGERMPAEMVRARGLIMSDPIVDPIVMHEAAWLWADYDPKDPGLVAKLRLQALADTRRMLQVTPVTDRQAWSRQLSLSNRTATELRQFPEQSEFLGHLLTVFARDPEIIAQIHDDRGFLLDDAANPDRSVSAAESAFAQAADAWRGMPKPPLRSLSNSLWFRARCASSADNSARSLERAIAVFKEAAAIAAAGEEVDSQASALERAAACEEPTSNPHGDWRRAADDYGRAAAAWASGKLFGEPLWTGETAQALLDQGRCLMQCTPPRLADARSAFAQAQKIADAAKDDTKAGLASYRLGLSFLPTTAKDGSWSRADECFAEAAKRFSGKDHRTDFERMLYLRGDCAKPDSNPGGSWKAAADFYAQSAAVAEAVGDWHDTATALSSQATCRMSDHNPAGSNEEAASLFARAASAYEKASDPSRERYTLHEQAWCLQPDHFPQGTWEQSAALYARAAELREASGAPVTHRAATLNNEAYCLRPDINAKGSWSQAQALYDQALGIATAENEVAQQASAWLGKATCAQPDNNTAGSWPDATTGFERAIALYRQTDDTKMLAYALHEYGWCLDPENNSAGSYVAAEAAFAEAIRLRTQLGDAAGLAVSLHNQAACYSPGRLPDGSWEKAARLYAEAAEKAAIAKDQKQQGTDLLNQATCLYNRSNSADDQVRALAQRAIDLARAAGDTVTVSRAQDLLKP
jgi:hypothetical protein